MYDDDIDEYYSDDQITPLYESPKFHIVAYDNDRSAVQITDGPYMGIVYLYGDDVRVNESDPDNIRLSFTHQIVYNPYGKNTNTESFKNLIGDNLVWLIRNKKE